MPSSTQRALSGQARGALAQPGASRDLSQHPIFSPPTLPRPVPLGSPVELVHELLHSAQVSVPDLLHQGDVVPRQDLEGQAQSCSSLARSSTWGTRGCLGWAVTALRVAMGGQQGPERPGREMLC